jgi:hypothetical protein
MAKAMAGSTKVMQASNKAMNIQKVQATMQQFAKESEMMDMKEELSKFFASNDTARSLIIKSYHHA